MPEIKQFKHFKGEIRGEIEMRKRILIVFNEYAYLRSLPIYLETFCDVDKKSALDEGLASLQRHNYDMLIVEDVLVEKEENWDDFNAEEDRTHTKQDYRGFTLAKAAKVRGAYVIGVISSGERFENADLSLNKSGLDDMELLAIIKKQLGV